MAKASEPSEGRRRDQNRRAVRRAADAAGPARATRGRRAARNAPEDQRPDEASARAPRAQAVPVPDRADRPKRQANRGSGTSAAARRVESDPSKPRAEDRQRENAPERLSEPPVAAGDRDAAVAPAAGDPKDRPAPAAQNDAAAGAPASASGPTVAGAPAAPMLDEGAAAREATGAAAVAAVDALAVARRGEGRASPAPPPSAVLAEAAAPDRAIRAFAAGSARLHEETLAFARAQVEDVARTGQALATCTSVSAAMALQLQAASRQFARCVAHGQTLASIGREMWQTLARANPGKDH
jgi:hypothetical protein